MIVVSQECNQATYRHHTASYKLQNHIIQTGNDIRNVLGCANTCNKILGCASFNWHDVNRACDINDATKIDSPVDYVVAAGWSYYDKYEEAGREVSVGILHFKSF